MAIGHSGPCVSLAQLASNFDDDAAVLKTSSHFSNLAAYALNRINGTTVASTWTNFTIVAFRKQLPSCRLSPMTREQRGAILWREPHHGRYVMLNTLNGKDASHSYSQSNAPFDTYVLSKSAISLLFRHETLLLRHCTGFQYPGPSCAARRYRCRSFAPPKSQNKLQFSNDTSSLSSGPS